MTIDQPIKPYENDVPSESWPTRRLLLRYQDDLGVNLRVIYGAQANKLDPEARGDMLKYLEQSLKKL